MSVATARTVGNQQLSPGTRYSDNVTFAVQGEDSKVLHSLGLARPARAAGAALPAREAAVLRHVLRPDVDLTDINTGWVFTRTVGNNAHVHIFAALKAGVVQVSFEVTGLDFENGSEFLNKAVI